ncbi:hypothetical protein L227DRAFT_524311, partial [Lentinus tigrinus ALCF2SS1-6]
MSHSLLPAKFDPAGSAYWLPKSGRLAASRLPIEPFWGLRTCFTDDERDNLSPPWLFAISSYPSPYPVENASFTLGPRIISKTGAVVSTDADILTTTPIPTKEERASWPLYLHILPALRLNTMRCSLFDQLYYTLTEDSLRAFNDGVGRCLKSAKEKQREILAAPHDIWEVKKGWFARKENPDTGAYMFGGPPPDPQKYVFNFDFDAEPKLPSFEGPSNVYDELMLYNQLCKDYQWRGVDLAIEWVREMRANTRRGWMKNPDTLVTTLPTEVCLDDDSRKRAMELAALDNPHARITAVLDERDAQRLEQAGEPHSPSGWSDSSDSSVKFLPRRFPHLPFSYPVVPFGPTKVVAFDIFGTILDRQDTLNVALGPWYAYSPVRSTTSLGLVVDRFLTLEALAARDAETLGTPTSFATCARSALINLARELGFNVDVRSAVFIETLKCILSPKPYPDVEAAITWLKQRGYTLVCLPTHSPTTMQQLRPLFPPAFADSNAVHMWTEHISAHFVARYPFFMTSKFQSFCESLVKETLQPSEILVVSSGIGRVLHAAVNAGHATAFVRRPWNLEGCVDFVVGDDEGSCPVPSLVVSGLMDLIARL